MVKDRFQRGCSGLLDRAMCAFLNLVHARTDDEATAPERLAEYLDRCAPLTPAEFYRVPDGAAVPEPAGRDGWITWASPVPSGYR